MDWWRAELATTDRVNVDAVLLHNTNGITSDTNQTNDHLKIRYNLQSSSFSNDNEIVGQILELNRQIIL